MPNHLQKSLQEFLSKLKRSPSNNQLSASKKWILSGCKHTKTLSLDIDRNPNGDDDGGDHSNKDAATLSDVDRFLFENFKSLYLRDDEDNEKKADEEKNEEEEEEEEDGGGDGGGRDKSPEGIFFESPMFLDLELPSNLRGSHRFFVAPGTSGSLMEEAQTSLGSTSTNSTSISTPNKTLNCESSSSTGTTTDDDSKGGNLPDDCIAILTYSPSPYHDFRRSMEEMVEARLQHQSTVDWDFMEELLFCYLNLNNKKSYKFILRAFVDLVVALRQDSNTIQGRSRNFQIERERSRRRIRMRHVT